MKKKNHEARMKKTIPAEEKERNKAEREIECWKRKKKKDINAKMAVGDKYLKEKERIYNLSKLRDNNEIKKEGDRQK